MLTLACALCQRKGAYSVARLQAKHGDARLTDLRALLTADCPNRAKRSIHAQCAAKYDPPPETRRQSGPQTRRPNKMANNFPIKSIHLSGE
jgi:hypothetical protein